MVTDRHYEFIQLRRSMFGCDKALLRVFLDAYDWAVGKHFHRQAGGLAQHHRMDVFEPIAACFRYETSAL